MFRISPNTILKTTSDLGGKILIDLLFDLSIVSSVQKFINHKAILAKNMVKRKERIE
jgi:hypothetical protein